MSLRKGTCLFLDILIAICGLVIVATLFNNWIFFRLNFDFPDRFINAAFWLLLVRVLFMVDFTKLKSRSDFHYDTTVVFSVIIFGLCMWHALYESMHHATRGVAVLRGSFQDVPEEVIGEEITNLNQYYPNYQFIHEVLRNVPEDARIAWFGDMRGHLVTYDLYPRRVYMLPETQEVLNRTAMECYSWSGVYDPIYPLTSAFDEYDPWEYKSDPEVQEAFQKMIEEKDINWVIGYSILYPEKCFYKKIK